MRQWREPSQLRWLDQKPPSLSSDVRSASLGGIFGFASGAASAANVTLVRVSGSGNGADAGAFAGSADGQRGGFRPPGCAGCTLEPDAAGASALATAAAAVLVSAPQSVRSGDPVRVSVRVQDGFGSDVAALSAVASLSCLWARPAGPDASAITGGGSAASAVPCNSAVSLRGSASGLYTNGSATIDVLLFGAPGSAVTLAASVAVGPWESLRGAGSASAAPLTSPPFNVSFEPCARGEEFDPPSGLCRAPPVAVVVAEGIDRRKVYAIAIPSAVGGFLLLFGGAVAAVLWARRSEETKWKRRLAAEKAILRCARNASRVSVFPRLDTWASVPAVETLIANSSSSLSSLFPRTTVRELAAALAEADQEAQIVDDALEYLQRLYPTALALVVTTFAGGSVESVSTAEVWAATDAARRALRKSLVPSIGVQQDGGETSSVSWACGSLAIADSRDFPRTTGEFLDWTAARNYGLLSARAFTAPVTAGTVVLGFIQLHFSAQHQEAPSKGPLGEFAALVGAKLFTHRMLSGFAVERTVTTASARYRMSNASSLESAFMKEQRVRRSGGSRHGSVSSAETPPAAARGGASGVSSGGSSVGLNGTAGGGGSGGLGRSLSRKASEGAAMFDKLDDSLEARRGQLLRWDLDPWALDDDEVAELAVLMFHSEDLLRRLNIRPAAMSDFVERLSVEYSGAPFHNWRHAFATMHTAWRFVALSAQFRALLTPLDTLALFLATLGHDAGHQGLTNSYLINSGAELALLHNDVHVLVRSTYARCAIRHSPVLLLRRKHRKKRAHSLLRFPIYHPQRRKTTTPWSCGGSSRRRSSSSHSPRGTSGCGAAPIAPPAAPF